MKTRFISIVIILFSGLILVGQTSPIELSCDYGPPLTADSFELFTIPITPESFNVDTATLQTVLESITVFKIRTEMHTGNDIGAVDNILVGSAYASYFDHSQEGWSSGGDGTLDWLPEGGYEGGYIQISDWATGDLHWVIAPASWSGDWSGLFGETISFYFKTNRPSYHAVVVLSNAIVQRLVLNTSVSTVAINDSTKVRLEVIPVLEEDLNVSISSSNSACLSAPSEVLIPAGHDFTEFYIVAAPDAAIGCESVIEAKSTGYATSRVTMQTVEDNSGIPNFVNQFALKIYPNPCTGTAYMKLTINDQQLTICDIYTVSGKNIRRLFEEKLLSGQHEIEVDLSGLPAGLYYIIIQSENDMNVRKLVIGGH